MGVSFGCVEDGVGVCFVMGFGSVDCLSLGDVDCLGSRYVDDGFQVS